MKKGTILLIAILGFFLIFFFWIKGVYNGMVTKDEAVSAKWGDVQTQYQRRMDLIPNLVNTVKGYANFEKSTLTAVIEARAKATSITIDASHLTNENVQQFLAAQGQLSSSLSRLLATVEQYPDLKADQNFLALQAQLEGTENRIATERKYFNDVVNDYNTYIRMFPQNIFAGMFHFQTKNYFAADQGANKAPEVKF